LDASQRRGILKELAQIVSANRGGHPMSTFHRAGLLAGIVVALAGSSSQAVDQQDIDKAIATGAQALRGMQAADGTWPHREIGATALAGLTLLECGAQPDDKDVVRAADAVRKASVTLTYNYSISLAILFFDRLGDPNDIPLIESLTVRLLAGQTSTGGWNYRSPPIPDAEIRRLQGKLGERKELVGRAQPPRAGGVKRTANELPLEIQQQLASLKRMSSMVPEMGSDNSNTQFATLALWIGRRYGLPVENALKRVETRFRRTQHADGGWGYFDPNMRVSSFMGRSTASMTCAGLLGLAVADGTAVESARERNPRAKPPRDVNKDPQVRRALLALSTTIGRPVEKQDGRQGGRAAAIPQIGGRSYYFLWSLERVAVALDLKTIGKKDWYAWGAEILLKNQQADGSWQGTYGECGADTCFALLFLKRANLVPDLTTQLAGRVQDPGERVLKPGELREAGVLEKGANLNSGVEGKDAKHHRDGQYPAEVTKDEQPQPVTKRQEPQPVTKRQEPQPITKPEPPPSLPDKPRASKPAAEDSALSPAGRMAADLAKSDLPRFTTLLHNFRLGKGTEFTEALALAIPQLRGERQRETRKALADRLTRMKESTLKEYLSDELLEIRIAAARACAIKGSKSLIPDLIPLLRDSRGGVAESAHLALKELSGQDFGPKANASREERVQAARQWTDWWNKQDHK
jgi:hypothetical protein